MANSNPEQMKKRMDAWMAWMKKHENALVAMGAPLGKTERVTAAGVASVRNEVTGYTISKPNRTMRQQLCLPVTLTSRLKAGDWLAWNRESCNELRLFFRKSRRARVALAVISGLVVLTRQEMLGVFDSVAS